MSTSANSRTGVSPVRVSPVRVSPVRVSPVRVSPVRGNGHASGPARRRSHSLFPLALAALFALSGSPAGAQDRAARPGALHPVEDEELVPGVRVFPLGCHTPGSQGILVQTRVGPVVLTGDVVYKYENIEKDCPPLENKGAPSCTHDCLSYPDRIWGRRFR
jgi:glyoxylase-like metal-dependent hydrolase (beta-lactamase superfamily II)